MLGTLTQDEIAERVKAINLTRNRLATMCGLPPSIINRGPQTIRKNKLVAERLREEELRVLRHLVGLFPQEAMAALCPKDGK